LKFLYTIEEGGQWYPKESELSTEIAKVGFPELIGDVTNAIWLENGEVWRAATRTWQPMPPDMGVFSEVWDSLVPLVSEESQPLNAGPTQILYTDERNGKWKPALLEHSYDEVRLVLQSPVIRDGKALLAGVGVVRVWIADTNLIWSLKNMHWIDEGGNFYTAWDTFTGQAEPRSFKRNGNAIGQ
jgi:hypothetical protein